MAKRLEINVEVLYTSTETAKLSMLDYYVKKAIDLAGEGNEIIFTGAAPIWLYLKIAHALHGKVRKLIYRSPVTGDVTIFDHSPE